MSYHQRLSLLIARLLLLPGTALGQINTERMRALDMEGFRSTLGADIAVESGHTELFEIGARARFDFRREPHYTFATGELRYGKQNGDPYRDRVFGHLRYNYQLLPSLVAEAFTQLQRDRFAQLQLRVLAGGGLRIRYFNREAFKLFQGTTPMYESENLDQAPLSRHPARVSTARWSNYLNLRVQLTEETRFIATVYVQPRFDQWSDVRVLNQVSFTVRLTEAVHLTTEFSLDYDSRPPNEVESIDISLQNGIEVSF
jgi:putative salt-induced outer membrane protein YdiY